MESSDPTIRLMHSKSRIRLYRAADGAVEVTLADPPHLPGETNYVARVPTTLDELGRVLNGETVKIQHADGRAWIRFIPDVATECIAIEFSGHLNDSDEEGQADALRGEFEQALEELKIGEHHART